MPSSSLIVPPCPAGVAFHKEDFLHEGFNVDGFLARYAGNYGLDSLRDDLGMYLQVCTYRLTFEFILITYIESTRLKRISVLKATLWIQVLQTVEFANNCFKDFLMTEITTYLTKFWIKAWQMPDCWLTTSRQLGKCLKLPGNCDILRGYHRVNH